jgi:serine/threonine protein kinase/formylglycine-generating enzyme required for sulfatase activity
MSRAPEIWNRIEEICYAALSLDASERQAFVASACAGDTILRREVESLLAQQSKADSFLTPSALEMAAHAVIFRDPGALAGHQLGPYELVALLGAGGMGEVYRAYDIRLRRDVAVKVLSTHLEPGADLLTRFEREARAAAALNHPHILAVYDVGHHERTPYIVTELLEGQTLAETLRQGRLPTGEILRLMLAVADALAAAHEKGIVHCDLKPANIFMGTGGRIKVLDFGLAATLISPTSSRVDETTDSNVPRVVIGTAAYVSPEQADGEAVDARSDIFSFGVVCYEAMSGRKPFQGDSRAAILAAIRSAEVPSLRDSGLDAPDQLRAIVHRCLERDPNDRPANGRELLEDLRRLARDLEQRESRWGSTRTKAVVLGSASVVLALSALIGVWWPIHSAQTRARLDATFAQIDELTQKGAYYQALRLARDAAKAAPADSRATHAIDSLTVAVSVGTMPSGADVFIADYRHPETGWEHLGQAPLRDVRVPSGMVRWKVEKPGYETVESAFWSGVVAAQFTLHHERPAGMVFVPGGRVQVGVAPAVVLPDYWIDRYEVTNREFRRFVEAGAYEKPQYWTLPFEDGGRTVSWKEAMVRFRDSTGESGPAGWEHGAFPKGEDTFPVHGVSWYEAAAYAEFAGKALPTIYHWRRAAGTLDYDNVSRVSNFNGKGPVAVGSTPDMVISGAYQMAGNVREWCWNSFQHERYYLGGAWDDPTNVSTLQAATSPLDRSDVNGFRTVKYITEPPAASLGAVDTHTRDYSHERPVSDEVFAAFRRLYSYDRADLQARVEATETTPYWRREKVSFAAAYSNERVIAQLLLPLNTPPPYQTVIWFGGADIPQLPSSDTPGTPFYFDYLVRGGRAVVIPVYQGTYERRAGGRTNGPNGLRDLSTARFRDLGRTIDYLATRPDIDSGKLGFYGFSIGANHGVVMTSLEHRIRAAVLLGAGLQSISVPPEINLVNFAPRVTMPVLMINGMDEFGAPRETHIPLFELLGTASGQKEHITIEGGHAPLSVGLSRPIVAWFDRYLGPVTNR